MYLYEIQFWLANDEKKNQINLIDWESQFLAAAKNFNLTQKTSRNKKQILKTELDQKSINLLVSSKFPLSTPTLALRSYSKFLVNTDFGAKAAVNNTLFRGSWKTLESKSEDITGPEMIKLLAQLLMTGKKSDEDIIQNIKRELIKWKEG